MRLRDKRNRSRGAAAAETAIVITFVLVPLFLGQIEASRLGMVSQLLTTAAREGCRKSVVLGATQSDVQKAVDNILSPAGISVGTVTPTCPSPYSWDTAPQGVAIQVSLSVKYKDVSWLGSPFYLKSDAQITASATMRSEKP
jgi:Flp pilus assembly protein TadG